MCCLKAENLGRPEADKEAQCDHTGQPLQGTEFYTQSTIKPPTMFQDTFKPGAWVAAIPKAQWRLGRASGKRPQSK